MTTATDLPASWHTLPERLRKPFWSIAEAGEVTGYSRSTLNRLLADPRSGFPARRQNAPGGRVRLPAIEVLSFMEDR